MYTKFHLHRYLYEWFMIVQISSLFLYYSIIQDVQPGIDTGAYSTSDRYGDHSDVTDISNRSLLNKIIISRKSNNSIGLSYLPWVDSKFNIA